MAFDINDWGAHSLENIKFSPIMQDGQRIIDIGSTAQTLEVLKKGINYTATHMGYFDGSQFIHYISSDGDAQLRWNFSEHQVIKSTKYSINLTRVNKTVEIDFHIELSSSDNPSFKIYDISNNLLGTLNLINAGNTNLVSGFIRFSKLTNGTVVTATYTYLKNITQYSEVQSAFFTTDIASVSFEADGAITYTSNSYAKITNK